MLVAVIGLAVLFAVIGAIIYAAVRASRRQQADGAARERAFAASCAGLGGRAVPGGFLVTVGGQGFTARITHHKGTPTGFVLETPVADSGRDAAPAAGSYRSDPRRQVKGRPRVRLRRETGRDSLGKRLDINREVQTGDEEFDARVYVESDAPDGDVREVLADERVRRGALGLLELGYREVLINDGAGRLSATFQTQSPESLDEAGLVRAAELMRQVAGALPEFSGPARSGPMWWAAAAAVGASAATVIAGMIVNAWAHARYDPLTSAPIWVGILLGLGALLLSLPVLRVVLRGRSTSFRVLLICGGVLVVGWPLLGAALAAGLNGALDEAPPVAHATTVRGRHKVSGKNSTTYYLDVDSWRPGERTVALEVPYGVYKQLAPGAPVVVTTGPGRFGWEWLRSVEGGRALRD